MNHFDIFNKLLSTQSVDVARFARNVQGDFFCNFQTSWKSNNYLDADPLEADDSHEVFMMDEGETPPGDDDEAMSNGTVVWAWFAMLRFLCLAEWSIRA